MRALLLAGVLASTCFTPPKPGPVSDPDPFPDGGDVAPAPAPPADPECDGAFDHLLDLGCPPAEGRAWLAKCRDVVSNNQLTCIIATDTCAIARACLE
jgi:hypothetical protein